MTSTGASPSATSPLESQQNTDEHGAESETTVDNEVQPERQEEAHKRSKRSGNSDERAELDVRLNDDVIGHLRGSRRSHLRSDLVGRSEEELQGLPQPGQRKKYAVSTRWEAQHASQLAEGELCPCTCSIEDFYTYCCCIARRRIGGMFFLIERSNGEPVVVAGPCWPFCTFITVPLILGVAAIVAYFILFGYRGTPMPWWVSLIYFPLLILTLISLFMVSCRDPGMVEKRPDEEAAAEGWYWNEQTSSFRPPGAMYCRECKVLIQDYDHLCPWTGTGIGKNNMLSFKVFVASINILCYMSIGLIAFSVIKSLNQ